MADDEILLKNIDSELSAFVVSKVDDTFVFNVEKVRDEGKKKQMEEEWKHVEENAKEKILAFVRLFPILTNKTPIVIPQGSRQIGSIDEIGKPPFPVERSIVIGTGLLLNEIVLNKTKMLHNTIKELNEKFSFLDTASKFYYRATKFTMDELEFGKFNSRQFVDTMITMECLFNDGAADIAHKLSFRTASLLGFIGYNRIDVFKNTKELYNMRNYIVHGIVHETGQKKPTLNHTYQLLDYAKGSLICSYILYGNRPTEANADKIKKELLKEVDYILLDDSKREEMNKEINSGIDRFNYQKIS